MSDCIFCKIINKEIPADIVYEDGYVMAFLNINPIATGHTLVVTKEHCENILVMAPSTMRRFFDAVQAVGAQVKKGIGCDGLNVSTNIGSAQMIKHAHVHVLPRQTGDGLKDWPSMKVTPEALKKTADIIKNANGKVI